MIVAGLVLFAASSLLLARAGADRDILLVLWPHASCRVRLGIGLIIPSLNVGAVQALDGSELAYASSGGELRATAGRRRRRQPARGASSNGGLR